MLFAVSRPSFSIGNTLTVTEDLTENVASRRAAAILEQTLIDLIALLRQQFDRVMPLLNSIQNQLATIRDLANKEEEKMVRKLSLGSDE